MSFYLSNYITYNVYIFFFFSLYLKVLINVGASNQLYPTFEIRREGKRKKTEGYGEKNNICVILKIYIIKN